MKRILFFIPDNPFKRNSGNKVRAFELLQYLKSKDYEIDFVSERSWGEWTDEDIVEFQSSGLAAHSYIFNRKAPKRNPIAYFLFYKLPNFFLRSFSRQYKSDFPDLVTIRLKKAFDELLKVNSYDYIFINYASWSSLIENNKYLGNAHTILDTHDFLTAQNQHRHDIGRSFKEEIRRISLFDRAFAISIEEQYIFSQFSKTPIELVPMMFEAPSANAIEYEKRLYDIIYVASINPHNVTAFKWYIEHVYPLLSKSINICVIGKITESIENDYPNLTAIPFAPSLDVYYQQSRIAICPMLSGTGVKIKVIEALSYGLPVICNTRGVDGLLNKTDNGCLVSNDPHEFAANINLLLQNPECYKQQSNFARGTFLTNYERTGAYKRLDQIFDV